MIKEDYVSFEIAKLLKEKGFDAECRAAYTNYGKLFTTQIQQYITNIVSSKGTLWDCIAPTHQMAMKWLREKHKILITIIPQEIGLGVDKLCYGIYKITEDLYQPLCNGKTDSLVNSYEEAVEAAIKYCLEHLI